MRFGRGETRLFLKRVGAGLLALLPGLLFLASSALALTWGEINQQVTRCPALANKAIILVESVIITKIRDDQSQKKARLTIKKIENALEQVIGIYQPLARADLPPAKVMPSILSDIKAAISRNLGKAEQCLKQAQSLRKFLKEKEPLVKKAPNRLKIGVPSMRGPRSLNATGMQQTLVISLRDLRYHTSWLQKRLQAHNLR